MTVVSENEQTTRALGLALGRCLRKGDAVLLRGDMGAGKSVLTRAAARGLGITEPIPSPTFTILNLHEGGRLRLCHFDLYRLEDADALWEMGLDEYLPDPEGVCFVEWPEMAEEAMPADALTVRMSYASDGMAREIALEAGGCFDAARVAEIEKAFAQELARGTEEETL